jgi:ectoine hydroxylase-related dioxygenase (phytanoyl-CoA dioxygenase family)
MATVDLFREGYNTQVMQLGSAFNEEETARMVDEFFREGWLHLRNVLTPEEVDVLKAGMIRKYDDERLPGDEEGDHIRGMSLMRMFEYHQSFRDLIVREPVVSLAEAILGEDCHMMAMNALRTDREEGITGWHVDQGPYFPCPDEIPRHDPRLRIPCYTFNALFPLTDIESIEHGPTEVVPGSHYSGRPPASQEDPEFEGRGPHPIFAKAGDVYIFHNQVWHHGALNRSDRMRYIATVAYSQRFVAQRFYPFLNYRMPDHVLEGADKRLLRLLGKHEKGAYG